VVIYGLHAVDAALANARRPVHRAWLTQNAADRLKSALDKRGIEPEIVAPKELDARLGSEAVHQGAMLDAGPLPPLDIADLADARLVLVLDQITDPHNVGAILRSAAAFGADAVAMTAHHSPPLSGALAKAASGGLERVGVALVANLARAMEALGEMGFERLGLDSDAADDFEACLGAPRVVIAFGAEDRGLRRLTRENCDRLCALRTGGSLRSLNVSNAAAIALYAASRKGAPGG
jgi:23S rRNA (guanosine2251-2'-O)-methyltransferase